MKIETVITFLLIGIGYIAEYGSRIIVGNVLGPEGLGIITFGMAITTMGMALANQGLPNAIAREISYLAAKEDSSAKTILPTAQLLVFGASIVICIVTYVGFSMSEIHDVSLILPFIIAIPFAALLRLYVMALNGAGAHRWGLAIQEISNRTIRLVLILIVIMFAGQALEVSFAYTVAYALSVVAALAVYSRILPLGLKPVYSFKKLLHLSAPLAIAVISQQAIGRIEPLILGGFSGIVEVGVFGAALSIVQVLLIVLQAVTFSLTPKLTRLYAQGNEKKMQAVLRKTVLMLGIVAIPLAFILMFTADQILILVFGDEFAGSSEALIILVIGYSVFLITSPYGHGLVAKKKYKAYLKASVAGILARVIVCFIAIPYLGVVGAAIGSTIGFVVMGVVFMWYGETLFLKKIT